MAGRIKFNINNILKAKTVSNPNNYVWIIRKNDSSSLISDENVFLEVYSKDRGIAFYYKDDKSNVILWRFLRSKGWDEVTAEAFALSYGAGLQDTGKAFELVNEYNGTNELSFNDRLLIYQDLKKRAIEKGYSKDLVPKLNNQFDYFFKSKFMKDKMKKLAEKSNIRFSEFMKYALNERADVVKSAELKQREQKGFRILGDQLSAYIVKEIRKNEDGTEEEVTKYKLKTRFTSNKADLYWDITSKDAIKKAIDLMKSEGDVLAIRFEHETLDYGAWDTFSYAEEDGVLYGYAEGELDMNLSRAKDLWTEIYTYGKKFATSYGGRWINYHIYSDEETGETFRVFDEVKWEEISLTTRPANPDTALEVLNKYAKSLEDCIDPTSELISNFNNQSMKIKAKKIEKSTKDVVLKSQDETTEETTQENETVETQEEGKDTTETNSDETTTETEVETTEEETVEEGKDKGEETTTEETTEEEKSKSGDSEKVITKALTDISSILLNLQEEFKSVKESNEALTKRLDKLEDEPADQKSTVELKNGTEEKKNVPEFNAQEEAEKRYPFLSMIAKAMPRE